MQDEHAKQQKEWRMVEEYLRNQNYELLAQVEKLTSQVETLEQENELLKATQKSATDLLLEEIEDLKY